MYCTKCGTITQENEIFCTQCGNLISENKILEDTTISKHSALNRDDIVELIEPEISNELDELTPPPIPNQIAPTNEMSNFTDTSINNNSIDENINTIDNTISWRAPFSFEGRIRRSEYGISLIIHIVCLCIPFVNFIYVLPGFWFHFAQGAKRCHDRGNSGWYQIIPLYPLILMFGDSDLGDNEYGNNPKGIK
jgi:hypothetical protein